MPPWLLSALWILFWITFVLYMLSGSNMSSIVTVLILLVVMRLQNNQLPMYAWIAFWLSAYHAWGSMFTKMDALVHDSISFILSILRLYITNGPDADDNYYQMPKIPFWVLTIALMPTQRHSRGKLVWQFVFMFNTYINHAGIHIPGVVISWWVVVLPLSPLIILVILGICVYILSSPETALPVFPFFVAMGVLHQQMWPWNHDFGLKWIAVWFLLYNALVFAFSPDVPFRPTLWYGSWAIAIVLIGCVFRPDQSYYRFLSWAATIWVLRLVVYMALMHYMPPVETPPNEPFQPSFVAKLRQQGTHEFSTTKMFEQSYGAQRPMQYSDEHFYHGRQW